MRRIVVGVGDLSTDDPTLRAAARMAEATGAELHLVYAYLLPGVVTGAGALEMGFPEGAQRYEEGLLESLRSVAREVAGGDQATCHVVLGSPAATLVRAAAELGAGLLVVGPSRASRLARAILGTTAQRVLRASPVPVLVVRRPVTVPPRRVLLTTDLSEFSAGVHQTALDTVGLFLGTPEEARSLLVMGWTPAPAPLGPDALARAARRELESFLDARGHLPPRVVPAVRTGIAADEIVAEARACNADLLVVGTHSKGWGQRLMLGSVSEAVLRDAPCNVLAVPPVRVPAAVGVEQRSATWDQSPGLKEWLPTAQ